MRTTMLAAATVCASAAAPATCQTLQAPVAGRMSAIEVGIEPMMRLSASDYSALARDNDRFEVAAARIALSRSRSPALRGLAARLQADHARAAAALGAARGPAAAALRMPFDRALRALASAPASRFDALYLGQVLDAHRHAWALHAGYAADGTDTRLRAQAQAGVAREEAHLRRLPMRRMRY